MHVEERDAIAFAQIRSVEAAQRAANHVESSGCHMSRDDRVRHPGEPAVPEVHVGAADLRSDGAQQRCSGREIRPIERSNLNRPPRTGHHGGEDAVTHVGTLPLKDKRAEPIAGAAA
jgi:hypothetical protein